MLNTYFLLDRGWRILEGDNAGKYHIKLCLDFPIVKKGKRARFQARYKTKLFTTQDEYSALWNEETKTKRQDLIKMKRQLFEIKAKADGILDKYKITDQRSFELFFLNEHNLELVSGQFELMISKKLAIKPKPKISTAEKYRTALNSFIEFSHPQLTFQEITPDFLREYQEWYLEPNKKGKSGSLTSVGYNCRHLRAVFNQAISLKAISSECYPFGKEGYIIPEGGKEIKEFLDLEQKDMFINYKPKDETTAYYFDFAIFDYYANGINFADILNLRKNQVFDDHILLERQKTEGRLRKSKKIVIPMHSRMHEIIKKRGNKTLDPNEYLFPILNRQMSFIEVEQTKKQFVRLVNKTLERIRVDLKIPVKITTYTIRHTFSYAFMQQGASLEDLQDAHGHGSIRTTENYNHGFGLARKKKFSEGL